MVYSGTLLTVLMLFSTHVIKGLLINRPTDMYSRYEKDTVVVEWDIMTDNYQPFLGEAYLSLRMDETLLFTVHLFDGSFDPTEVNKNGYHVNFSNSREGRFGVVLSDIRVLEAGIYSCSYKDTEGSNTEYGNSTITVFVFAAPEKPEIRASGPMTAGRDVTLECVTQSTSLPIGSRPEMRITWYRDGMIFTLDSQDDISIVDDKLEIEDLSGTMIHYYNCSALEAGSNIIVYSNGFPVVLLVLDPISRDITDAHENDDVTLIWRLYPRSDIIPTYNRTVSFTKNTEIIATWNLKYIHWTSSVDRMTYYNPAADQHGFKLHGLLQDDMGHYACVYQDEFGTLVTSANIALGLEGHILPPPVTKPIVETSSRADSSEFPHTAGSINDGKQPKKGISNGVLISVVLGAALLILLAIVIAYVIKRKRRKKKEPKSLMREREPPEQTVRYRNAGSVISVYSTLRESLMVSDDVIAASPVPPPRDDTYNQPFEDTRAPLSAHDIEDSYLTPIGCDEVLKEKSFCNNDGVQERQLCNNQSLEGHHQENVYLTPVNQSATKIPPACQSGHETVQERT